MSTDTPRSQESTGTVTGPHDGRDREGTLDHRYWRCERCGLETTDPRLREGCFRCGEADRASNSEVDQTSNSEADQASSSERYNREPDGTPTDGTSGKTPDHGTADGGAPDA